MDGYRIKPPQQIELRKPLLTDTATAIMAVVFALCSFATIGAEAAVEGLLGLPYGATWGVIFLISATLPPVVPRLLGRSRNRVVRWFRLFYVQIYYLLFFSEAIHISYAWYGGRTFDRLFVRLEHWIFGFQPSLRLYRALPDAKWLVEIMFFSYAFYFLLFSIGIWALFFRGRERYAFTFLSVVTLGFYLLYLVYLVFPVAGPKYHFPELSAQWYQPFEGYLFTDLLKRTFDSMDLYGAAFPSSHAAIATVSLCLNFRYQRLVAWIALPITLLLLISTVYIYAHYAVDTIAGVLVGLLFFAVLPGVVTRLGRRHDHLVLGSARSCGTE